MLRYLVVPAILGTMSVSAPAQTAPGMPTTNQAQAAKPQMVKKLICEDNEDNPYSRITKRVCRTIEVPARPASSTSNGQQAAAPAPQPNSAD